MKPGLVKVNLGLMLLCVGPFIESQQSFGGESCWAYVYWGRVFFLSEVLVQAFSKLQPSAP
jgi:hypothetical protein